MLAEKFCRDVMRHEEPVAAARDTAPYLSNLTQGDEAIAELAHDVEVKIGRPQVSAPLSAAVVGVVIGRDPIVRVFFVLS